MKTVIFSFQNNNKGFPNEIPKNYPEVLQFSGEFSITVNGCVSFFDSEFNIFEFLASFHRWDPSSRQAFEYCSLDSEQNPLLTFIPDENVWVIKSPWQKFDCHTAFTTQELISAVEEMVSKMGY